MEIYNYESFLESIYDRKIKISDKLETIEDIIGKYAPYALESIKRGTYVPIYKGYDFGWSGGSPIFIDDPSKFKRKSAYSDNYYTLLIDNSPYWEEYPKRSESIICSTNSIKARSYGKSYVAIPLNPDTKFGVCPESDIWQSFDNLFNSMDIVFKDIYSHFNFIKDGIKRTGFPGNKVRNLKNFNTIIKDLFDIGEIDSYNELVKELTIDKIKKVTKVEDDDQYIKDLKWHLNGNIIEWLNKQMDPIKNDFELLNLSELNGKKDNEVWIDSPCLMIRYKTYRKLFEINNEN